MPDIELLPFAISDDHEFELLCCDIMEQYYSDSSNHLPYPNSIPCYRLYGRNGQPQNGIDIISSYTIEANGYYVAQCKNYYRQKDGKKLVEQLNSDITKINNSGIKIARIFVFTSLRRDIYMQNSELKLIASNINVTLLFWENISEYVLSDPVLCAKWCKKVNLSAPKQVISRCPKCFHNMEFNADSKQFECGYCSFKGKINVFVSLSSPINQPQSEFCNMIEDYLINHGLDPITLGHNIYDMELPVRGIKIWMERCYGLLALGLSRTQIEKGYTYKKYTKKQRSDNALEAELTDQWETSPFCHIEPAIAYSLDIPIIMFREKGVRQDGMFDGGIVGQYMPEFDLTHGPEEFFYSKECQQTLQLWIDRVISTWNLRNQELH